MATEVTIPDASVPLTAVEGRAHPAWYRIFSRWADLFNQSTASLDDASTGLGSKLSQGKHTIWVPAVAMYDRGSSAPALGTFTSGSSNLPVTARTLDFDPTTEEFVYFWVAMPKSWNEGTITYRAVWSHPATVTNFGVVFNLYANAFSNDDTLNANAGTPGAAVDTGGTTDDLYISDESAAVTVAGTPAEHDIVHFRLNRVPGNASDTLAVDARLHGIILYINISAGNDE
jgi:hypothetical protein